MACSTQPQNLCWGTMGILLSAACMASFVSFVNRRCLQCGNFHDLAAQFLCQLVNADLVAVLPNDVHHVDRDNYRNAQFYQCVVRYRLRSRLVPSMMFRIASTLLNQIFGQRLLPALYGERE